MSRTIKVHAHVRPSRYRKPAKVTSSIKLQGDWLKDAGFQPGYLATVEIHNLKIVIS
jgi:hypothetical protein